MRLIVLSLLGVWVLNQATLSFVAAATFALPHSSSGVELRGQADAPAGEKTQQPKYLQSRDRLKKKIDRIDRYPHSLEYPDGRYETTVTRPRPRPGKSPGDDEAPPLLNPDIFAPRPKPPFTLIIEDGDVVDSYRGY